MKLSGSQSKREAGYTSEQRQPRKQGKRETTDGNAQPVRKPLLLMWKDG